MIVDRAELADGAIDRADEVGVGQRPHAGPQGAGEEVVEAAIAADVGLFSLAHVDAVFLYEPPDQPGGERSPLRAGNPARKLGKGSFGQQVLDKDGKALGHGGSGYSRLTGR